MKTSVVAIDARLVGGSSTGDSTYWTGLLEGLSRLDADIRYLLFSNQERPSGIPWYDRFEWVRLQTRSSRWWSLVAFPLTARKKGAKAVHTQYSLSPLVQNGITTIHDVSFLIGPEWFKPKDRFLLTRSVPASAKRARAVLAVSETDKKEMEQYIPASRGKITVTPNACPSWIQAVDPTEAAQRVERELGVTGPFLLTVGTRWPRKNMALAVNAASLLPDNLPHRLVVTGKAGWGDNDLGKRGVAVGYVSTELLSCLYSAASLYLAPSLHEGFGIPLLEAFRCGCPVLCSSGGALPEVASDAAIVEPSWEPAQWATTTQSTLQDSSKLESLRRRGRERETDFSWDETARLTVNAYLGAMR